MDSKVVAILVLPIVIVSVILGSLFLPTSLSKNPAQQENKNLTKILNPIEYSTKQTPPPKNPTPETVQVLGVKNTQEISTPTTNFNTETLYRLVNSYRLENDLNKLFINKTLEESARRKLRDMKENGYFNHADRNNNESWYLFQAVGYQYKFAGENLSTGVNTPWQVFTAWQESTEHNYQLLKPDYLDMGLAVDCSETAGNKPYCVVVLHLGAR